jgi:hypothetical protein
MNIIIPKEPKSEVIDQKLDELIKLISTENLDPEAVKKIQDKLKNAIERHAEGSSLWLNSRQSYEHKLINSTLKRHKLAKRLVRICRIIVSLLLILLGFGMIIMPAPPYFEMFTLFYLNPNDGVTIMDIISLIVAFIGISILISTLLKLGNH